eukprot:4422905-Prymnesium_polylepis.1
MAPKSRSPTETDESNVPAMTSYTPTASALSGAIMTRFPTVAAPENLLSMVRLPVATTASNAMGGAGGGDGGRGGEGGKAGAGQRALQSVQSEPSVQSAYWDPGPPVAVGQ